MRPEVIAAMFEAVEEVGDDDLVLSVLLALRDDEARSDITRLMSASGGTRAALRGVLSRDPASLPANERDRS